MSHARRITSNSLFLLGLTVSNYAVGLLLFPFISRTLSIEGFGLVGLGMTCALIFQSVVDYGFMISTTAKVAQHREDTSRVSQIVSSAMLAKLILTGVALLIFLSAVTLIEPLRAHPEVLAAFFISGVTTSLVPDFYFRGVERMKAMAIRGVLTRLAAVGVAIILVKDDSDIPAIPLSLTAANLVAIAVSFAIIRRDGISCFSANTSAAWSEIHQGFFLFVSRIAVTINQSLAVFSLGYRYSSTSLELGLYTGAARIATAGEMLIIPISDSLYPHMVKRRDYYLLKRVYLGGLGIWLTGCVVVFIFAPDICRIILGAQYESSGSVLRILVIGTFLAFSSVMFGYSALAPLGLTKHANISLIVGLAINVTLLTVLHLTGNLSLLSVACVMAFTNLSVLSYRATVLYIHRALIIPKPPESSQ